MPAVPIFEYFVRILQERVTYDVMDVIIVFGLHYELVSLYRWQFFPLLYLSRFQIYRFCVYFFFTFLASSYCSFNNNDF